MRSHFKWSIRNRPLAQALDGNALKEIISDESLDVINEEERCKAVIDWHQHRGARLTVDEFRQVMEKIDWTLIPEQSMLSLVLAGSEHIFRYNFFAFFTLS